MKARVLAHYPLTSFYFTVAIHGVDSEDSAFQDVSGFSAEREIEEVAEGGENGFVHRLPKRVRHQNLVLKRGLVDHATALFRWCARALESDLHEAMTTQDIVVSLLDPDARPIVRWSFVRAWPVKMEVAAFNARESEVAIETLEFSFQSVRRAYVAQAQ